MPATCWTCKSPDVPRLMNEIGIEAVYSGKWASKGTEMVNNIGCADCHNPKDMSLQITRPALIEAFESRGEDITQATHQEMRSLVCAQCHVEYYFNKKKVEGVPYLTFPWDKGFSVEAMEQYYDDIEFKDWTHALSKAPMLKAQHPGYEIASTGIHFKNGVSCADCHMPVMQGKDGEYTSHNVSNPLENMALTCLNCHDSSEQSLKDTVARKLQRKNELNKTAMGVIAKAHLEAGKAWERGATEAEMKDILQDIRHAQWRWDYSIASHGSFFHAPEETLRILGSAINIGQNARVKLRAVLAKYNAGDFAAPDVSTKEKAQAVIGLPYQKLVDEKMTFLNGLRKEWIKEQNAKGLYDPNTEDGMKFNTSYAPAK